MLVPSRFSLGTVVRDYSRSLRKFKTGGRDWSAIALLLLAPSGVAIVTVWNGFVFPAPTALLPAVALLAGVLLAAAGQIVTLRARIADSLVLSTDARVTGHIRETMSGVVLAAVAALVNALLLGALAAATTAPAGAPPVDLRWWHTALSAATLATTTYLALMFIITARRLYSTYLEVFEGGTPLPKIRSRHERGLDRLDPAGSTSVH